MKGTNHEVGTIAGKRKVARAGACGPRSRVHTQPGHTLLSLGICLWEVSPWRLVVQAVGSCPS